MVCLTLSCRRGTGRGPGLFKKIKEEPVTFPRKWDWDKISPEGARPHDPPPHPRLYYMCPPSWRGGAPGEAAGERNGELVSGLGWPSLA